MGGSTEESSTVTSYHTRIEDIEPNFFCLFSHLILLSSNLLRIMEASIRELVFQIMNSVLNTCPQSKKLEDV